MTLKSDLDPDPYGSALVLFPDHDHQNDVTDVKNRPWETEH